MTQLLRSHLDKRGIAYLELTYNEMKKVEEFFSGVTYTQGRLQPYAIWDKGTLVAYAKSESHALETQRRFLGI